MGWLFLQGIYSQEAPFAAICAPLGRGCVASNRRLNKYGDIKSCETIIAGPAADPDWLRVGTDIIDGGTPPTFNAAFTLDGATLPEPASLPLLGAALVLRMRRLRRRRARPQYGVNLRRAP
jgi:hypothetical protein